jgi:ribulose-phosphate 3-epimerase
MGVADMLLIMTVNPGFGGQSFIPYTVGKIRQARQIIENRGYGCAIEVDGGIDTDTMPDVLKAGAEVLVAGSAIFHSPDPVRKIKEMLEIAARLGYDSNYV